jgi:uncharacterized protein
MASSLPDLHADRGQVAHGAIVGDVGVAGANRTAPASTNGAPMQIVSDRMCWRQATVRPLKSEPANPAPNEVVIGVVHAIHSGSAASTAPVHQSHGDSVKVARIKAIQKEGLEPIIRIIARGLTSEEALMVETALIWKLGRTLTNVASGQYVGRFRPPDTLHKRLARFDFENGIYYVNVGEGETRNWADCRRFGFLAAGGDPKWSDQIRGLEEGDVVVAYLKGAGYVGVGVVRSPAAAYAGYRCDGRTLAEYELVEPNIGHDASDLAICEYIVAVGMDGIGRPGERQVATSKWALHIAARTSIAGCPTSHHGVHRGVIRSESGCPG